MKLTVKQVVNITNGKLLLGREDIECEHFSKDTRTIKNGDIYVGIKGLTFNGNKFYQEAIDKGAIACILDEEPNYYSSGVPIILVKDTIKAIQDLASYVRDNSNVKVISITGSVGKTSTKDLITKVLKEKYTVLSTKGNFNNEIGLPLAILDYKKENIWVLEMGMNHLGEISLLSKIAKPDIAVITNVGTAHLGNLGSRENILKAKLEIIDGLQKDGVLIVNNDNDLLQTIMPSCQLRKISINNVSDYQAFNIIDKENGTNFDINIDDEISSFFVPMLGEAFVYNSLCAIAVGKELGLNTIEIQKGLDNFVPSSNRLDIIKMKNYTIINDTYNANLEAMNSALDYLQKIKTKRSVAILGDILELGDYAKEIHSKIGELVVQKKIDLVLVSGTASLYISETAKTLGMKEVYYYSSKEKLIKVLSDFLQKEDTILVKASNGMNFNEIVDYLKTDII